MRRLDRLWTDQPEHFPSPFASLAGTRVGRYVVERVIGRGAFGIVYKARDEQLGRDVALKVPRPEVLMDADQLSRFKGEAVATASLDHPGIVALYEAELGGATPYLASAYCPGPNLQQWLDESPPQLAEPEAVSFITALAEAVHYAHEQGIVHRDLKPSNVLLSPNSDTAPGDETEGLGTLPEYQPKLTDFGLARLSRRLEDTRSSVMLGTPLYMAPEQSESRNEDVGPASDVFALGAILYRLLTGEAPFAASSYPAVLIRMGEGTIKPLSQFRKDVSVDLETICLKCLQQDPADRYKTAQALADDLQRYLRGESINARPIGWWRTLRRWSLQPARVPEAMLVVMIVSGIRLIFGTLGILFLFLLNETSFTEDELREAVLVHLCLTNVYDLWNLWAARRNRSRRLRRFVYFAVFALFLSNSVACLLISLGVIPSSLWYQRSPGARVLAFLMISLMFMVQSLCWYIGDWHRGLCQPRRYPGRISKRIMVTAALTVVLLTTGFHFRLKAPAAGPAGPDSFINLDGVDDYVVVEDVGFPENQPFTLEMWIRPDRAQRGRVVGYGPVDIEVIGGGNGTTRIRANALISADDAFLIDTNHIIPPGHWVHVAVTYDQRNLAVWLNGDGTENSVALYVSETDEAISAELPDPLLLRDIWPGSPLRIGAVDSGLFHFSGDIGEVRLSRSVIYRGKFAPVTTMSVAPDTEMLFHLNNDRQIHTDATRQHKAVVLP